MVKEARAGGKMPPKMKRGAKNEIFEGGASEGRGGGHRGASLNKNFCMQALDCVQKKESDVRSFPKKYIHSLL